MVHMCNICNKQFDDLFGYNRHINNKNTCNPALKEQNKKNKLECHCCGKILSSKVRLESHVKLCVQKKVTDISNLTNMIGELKNTVNMQAIQMSEQNAKIEQLIQKEDKPNITITNNSNNVNQTQNIYGIVPFGKENLDYITVDDYNTFFSKGCRSIQHFIEFVYCNKDKPENMNVYISNFKDKYIRTFNGEDWTMENKEDVIYNMFNSKRDFLEFKYKDLKNSLTSDAKYYFGKMYYAHGRTNEAIDIIKEDMKDLLYRNKDYVIKNPRKPKKNNKMIKNGEKLENFTHCDYIPEFPMF